ncbi:MAG TPA: hypothetical protein DIU00_19450 [Phycisphaerales bacterium]|nr:hypothetical protein [Phycisphaerales bacterium]
MESEQNTTVEQKKQPWLLSLLFDNQISMWKYVLRTGLISLVPSLIISMILGLTGIMTEETTPEFEGSAIGLFILLVIIGPPLETLLMAGGLWILSFITKRPVRLAIISAIIWATVHSLMAPAWGLGVIWPFFVFSCSYLGWRRRSWWRAILVTSCVHAFQNILPAIAVIATL